MVASSVFIIMPPSSAWDDGCLYGVLFNIFSYLLYLFSECVCCLSVEFDKDHAFILCSFFVDPEVADLSNVCMEITSIDVRVTGLTSCPIKVLDHTIATLFSHSYMDAGLRSLLTLGLGILLTAIISPTLQIAGSL